VRVGLGRGEEMVVGDNHAKVGVAGAPQADSQITAKRAAVKKTLRKRIKAL
jgi:hypothetical protein